MHTLTSRVAHRPPALPPPRPRGVEAAFPHLDGERESARAAQRRCTLSFGIQEARSRHREAEGGEGVRGSSA